MKLNKNEKNDRKRWKAEFVERGGRLIQFEASGVTVAVRPMCGDDSRFCEVAVAYCNFNADAWNWKRGQYEVLQKAMNEHFMIVPTQGDDPLEIACRVYELVT